MDRGQALQAMLHGKKVYHEGSNLEYLYFCQDMNLVLESDKSVWSLIDMAMDNWGIYDD